jgi:hypothetical protein
MALAATGTLECTVHVHFCGAGIGALFASKAASNSTINSLYMWIRDNGHECRSGIGVSVQSGVRQVVLGASLGALYLRTDQMVSEKDENGIVLRVLELCPHWLMAAKISDTEGCVRFGVPMQASHSHS